jgi:hypothetical protein
VAETNSRTHARGRPTDTCCCCCVPRVGWQAAAPLSQAACGSSAARLRRPPQMNATLSQATKCELPPPVVCRGVAAPAAALVDAQPKFASESNAAAGGRLHWARRRCVTSTPGPPRMSSAPVLGPLAPSSSAGVIAIEQRPHCVCRASTRDGPSNNPITHTGRRRPLHGAGSTRARRRSSLRFPAGRERTAKNFLFLEQPADGQASSSPCRSPLGRPVRSGRHSRRLARSGKPRSLYVKPCLCAACCTCRSRPGRRTRAAAGRGNNRRPPEPGSRAPPTSAGAGLWSAGCQRCAPARPAQLPRSTFSLARRSRRPAKRHSGHSIHHKGIPSDHSIQTRAALPISARSAPELLLLQVHAVGLEISAPLGRFAHRTCWHSASSPPPPSSLACAQPSRAACA